jgi:hypothetical protein
MKYKICPFCRKEIGSELYKCNFCNQTLAEKINTKANIRRPRNVLEMISNLFKKYFALIFRKKTFKIIWSFLIFIFVIYCLGNIVVQKGPCESPIKYKIGTLDPRFDVSEEEFKKDINQASNIWGDSINKKLFEYNPNGNLTINLVYDTRQQTTQNEQVLNKNISETSQVADSVKQEYSSLKENYQLEQQEYQDQLDQFNQAQNNYNDQVDSWNSVGGAPENEYSLLETQKNTLVEQQDSLESKRQQVNQLATDVNAFIDKYNLLVNNINSNIDTINNDGLTGTQFEEGVYISDSDKTLINIYQFDNKTYFIRVLAHELGHALQLDHNNNPDSIMNPVNQKQTLVLSSDDLQELKTECNIK